MKAHYKFLILTLSLFLFNCNKETAKKIEIDYKYANKEATITCENINSDLYKEALYAFESDITKFYDPRTQNVYQAYNKFFKAAIVDKVSYKNVVSPHTMKIFEALKAEKELWKSDNPKALNYNAPLFKCLSENFKDKDFKITFNALASTNSMSPKLFGQPILSQLGSASRDKYLTVYIALDFYYSRLFDINPDNIIEKPEPKIIVPVKPQNPNVDFNKRPQ